MFTPGLRGGEGQVGRVPDVLQLRDHLGGIALVNEEGLPLGREGHLARVQRHERVEEGVEALLISPLGPQDAAEALGFLTTGAVLCGDLNKAGRLGEIEGCVANLREEEGIALW